MPRGMEKTSMKRVDASARITVAGRPWSSASSTGFFIMKE